MRSALATRVRAGAGGLSAAVLLAPEAMAAPHKRRSRACGAAGSAREWRRATRLPVRNRRCGPGWLEVEGTRHGGAPGGPRPRLPQGRGPRPDQDDRAKAIPPRRAIAGLSRTRSTTTASPPAMRRARSGRFRTALPPDSNQPVGSPSSPARTSPSGTSTRTRSWPRRTSTSWSASGDYIYAEDVLPGRRPHRRGA